MGANKNKKKTQNQIIDTRKPSRKFAGQQPPNKSGNKINKKQSPNSSNNKKIKINVML